MIPYIADSDGTLLNSAKRISRFTSSAVSALVNACMLFFMCRCALKCLSVKEVPKHCG